MPVKVKNNFLFGLLNMSDLNDPRVLFAAERTLLAWNRTSISLMAFGFLIERFALFLQLVGKEEIKLFQRHISFFVGVSFILLAAFLAIYSIWQHKRVLKTLRPAEIPSGYNLFVGITVNGIIGFLGIALSVYLARGFVLVQQLCEECLTSHSKLAAQFNSNVIRKPAEICKSSFSYFKK